MSAFGRAELGRKEWDVLHAAADALEESGPAMDEFIALASALVLRYPCHDCRKQAQTRCHHILSMLADLRNRAEGMRLSYRVVAVAWTARFHACVTHSILRSAEGGEVSRKSAALALTVAYLGADDAAIADAVSTHEL
jgi:hypothetical protein